MTETGQNISTLRSDNGDEYIDAEFDTYLASNEIRHDTTAPYTPEQKWRE